MKNIFLTTALTLVYIFLLTGIFENFINRSANTLLTVTAISLFLVMTFLLTRFIIKQFKNH